MLFLCSLMFLATSCDKDPCNEVVCQNGGICVDGDCDCPPNYSGIFCQNYNPSDPCAGVNCQNGGICVSGDCDCPPNYSGTFCQNYNPPDPCAGVNCQNGGVCVSGGCNCKEGFYGNLCQYKLDPKGVYITKVVLTNFPEYKSNGGVWDNQSVRPDIFLVLEINDNEVATTGYYTNCSPNNDYTYTTNFPVFVSKTYYKITLKVYDYDGATGSELMSSGYFFLEDYESGLPSILSLGNSSINFKLHLDWTF